MEDSASLSRDNLLHTAKNLLDFLECIDQFPHLRKGPLLKEAIRRYEALWLPLITDQTTSPTPLVAPRDIAWVWYTHVLSTSCYIKDCTKLFNKVPDHMLRKPSVDTEDEGYKTASLIWGSRHPNEPFEVNLTRPPKRTRSHESRLMYNLEQACEWQFAFYYSVALPHYRDEKFLGRAFERYQEHLELMKEHQMASIPCRDVDLLWRAHRVSPLAYKQDMMALIGRMPSHKATETHSIPLSRVRDSELASRLIWSRAGKRFEKPGTAHRGEPPEPISSRPAPSNATYGVFEYEAELLQFEACIQGPEDNTYLVQLAYSKNQKPFYQQKVTAGATNIETLATFKLRTGTMDKIQVQVFQPKFLRNALVATQELDLQPQMRTLPAVQLCHEIDMSKDFHVKLSIFIRPPKLMQYVFTVPQASCHGYDTTTISQAMGRQNIVSPLAAVAHPMARCAVSNQAVMNPYGRELFKCRVVHSSAIALSAIDLIDKNADVVSSAQVIEHGVLPTKDEVTQPMSYITADSSEGERSVIVRGTRDWAICVGRWMTVCKDEKKKKYSQYLGLKVYKLQNPRGWCAVRKYKEGLYLIQTAPEDTKAYVSVNLTSGEISIAPAVQDVPEALALGFSVALLHLLCQPYEPSPSKEASPSAFRTRLAHPHTVANESLTLVVAVGFFCDSVPTNEYMMRTDDNYVPASEDLMPTIDKKVVWRDIGYRQRHRYFRKGLFREMDEEGENGDETEDFTKGDGEWDEWGDVRLQGRPPSKTKSEIKKKLQGK